MSVLTAIGADFWAVSGPVFEDLRGAGAPIADYAPIDPEGVTYSDGRSTEQIGGAYITPSYFTTLGVQPAMGQAWRDGDRQVAMVSWRFWQEQLGGAADVVGRFITINGTPHAVVGVLPERFVPPYFTTTAVWMPLDLQPLMAGSGRARQTLTLVARLSPGATVDDLNASLGVLTRRLQQQYPEIHGRQSWVAKPLREEMVGSARTVLLGVGAAAALLILIVFANIAGLSAARAVGMQQQVAVRLALGATRGRVLFERLVDSLVVALAGSVAGVWLGDTLITIIAAYQDQFMPRLAAVELDWTAAVAGLAAGVVTGVAAAVVPSGGSRIAALEALRRRAAALAAHGPARSARHSS